MSLPRDLFASRGADGQPGELLLRCTACGGKLLHFEDESFLLCPSSRLRFPITEDGIPVMLVEEATQLSQAQVEALVARAPRRG